MLLVVFDLNGTLVSQRSGQHIVTRPHFAELLEFLCHHHDEGNLRFATWTSRPMGLSNRIVNAIFPPEVRERLMFTFDRSRCLTSDVSQRKLTKDLTSIWTVYTAFNIANTVIVDDTQDKILYSQRRSHYQIPTWYADRPEEIPEPESDTGLLNLIEHLRFRIDRGE